MPDQLDPWAVKENANSPMEDIEASIASATRAPKFDLDAVKANCNLIVYPYGTVGYREFAHCARTDLPACVAEIEKMRKDRDDWDGELEAQLDRNFALAVERDSLRARVKELESQLFQRRPGDFEQAQWGEPR